jgi:rod shape-determining protein MreC
MAQYLNYDQSSKNGLSIYYYIHSFFKKIEFIFLLVACLVFIGLSKGNKEFNDKISLFFVELSLPVSNAITLPFGAGSEAFSYVENLATARKENILLRAENEKLKAIYIKALNISQENEELQELLQFISTKSIKYKAVRLITKVNQSYGNSIIINAGSSQGIGENNIITGKRSIVGRVIQVGENVSRVLTITDENSKIPVITSNSRARGILAGNNNKTMTIEYLDKDHQIEVGDMVFTSGDGEYLPPGLLAGIVTKVNGGSVKVKAVENPDNINLAAISSY